MKIQTIKNPNMKLISIKLCFAFQKGEFKNYELGNNSKIMKELKVDRLIVFESERMINPIQNCKFSWKFQKVPTIPKFINVLCYYQSHNNDQKLKISIRNSVLFEKINKIQLKE